MTRDSDDLSITVAIDGRDLLGEGPVWDAATRSLWRVDITGRRVHRWTPSTDEHVFVEQPGDVSAVLLAADDALVVAVEQQLVLVDGSRRRVLGTVANEPEANRFNDCRCDPQGRIWAGTLNRDRTIGAASLYRLDGSELTAVRTGCTISNGIGWSPDGTQMYHIDSTTQAVDVFDFDGSNGEIANRRVFAAIDDHDGLPDGLTIDAEGGVWVCLFGGGAVRRYSASGELDRHVPLPITNPTCPTFGGDDLQTIYVTSARHRLSPAQLAAEPRAGCVLAIDGTGASGLPANRYVI